MVRHLRWHLYAVADYTGLKLFILAVVEMKSSTSYGTLMAASSNKYEETVYNPATLGKMKDYSEWKTMVKVRTLSDFH